jgi:hypothetical protein
MMAVEEMGASRAQNANVDTIRSFLAGENR